MADLYSQGLTADGRGKLGVMVGRRKVFLDRVLLAILRREFLPNHRLVRHWAKHARRMAKRAELLHGDITNRIKNSVDGEAVGMTLQQYRDSNTHVMQQVDQTLAGVANGPNLLAYNQASADEIHQQSKAAVAEIVRRLEAWLILIADDDLIAEQDPSRLSDWREEQLYSDVARQSIIDAFVEAQQELRDVLSQCDGLTDDESRDPVELCLRARWAFYVFLARLLVAPGQLLEEVADVVKLHEEVRDKFEELRKTPAVVEKVGETMLDLCISSTNGRLKMLTKEHLESLIEETVQIFVSGQKQFAYGQ